MITIVKPPGPHEVLKKEDIEGKVVKQISQFLKLDDNILSIETASFSEPLDPECNLLEEYPELVYNDPLEAFSYPEVHLKLIPKENQNQFVRFFLIKCLDMDVTFPKLPVTFNRDNIAEMKIDDILQLATKSFEYQTTSCKLLFGDEEIKEGDVKEILEKAKTQPITFQCQVDDKSKKKIMHRIHLANEMKDSEEKFIHDLTILNEYWEPAFRANLKLSEVQYKSIFRDIMPILKIHKQLLELMKQNPISFDTCYGVLFLNFVDKFKVSRAFIANFHSIDDFIKNQREKSSFNSKFKEIEDNNPECNGRDFLSYYIHIVQRYPRYPLLIRDLNKQTPSFHPDKSYLQRASNQVDSINKNLDQTSHKIKQIMAKEQLSKDLEDYDILENGRDLIHSQNVRIVKPKIGSGFIHLFNDLVLVTHAKGKKQSCVVAINFSSFRFTNCVPTTESISFVHENKEYVLTFNEMSDKMVWMESYYNNRNEILSTISTNNSYGIWRDVDFKENVPALLSHDGCPIDNGAFFFGGSNVSLTATSTVVKYQSNAFNISNVSIPPRVGHSVNCVGKYVYICFGNDKAVYYNDIWRYDPKTDEYKKLQVNGDVVVGRSYHSCAVYDKKLVFFGGETKRGLSNELDFFDTETFEFKIINSHSPPLPRMCHSASISENHMIVVGGKKEKDISSETYVLNLEKLKWRRWKNASVSPRFGHRAIISGRWLFIIGGVDKTGPKDITLIDTFNNNIVDFEEYGNKPFGLFRFGAVLLEGDEFLVFGGTNGISKRPTAGSYKFDFSDSIKDIPIRVKVPKPKNHKVKKAVTVEKEPIIQMRVGPSIIRKNTSSMIASVPIGLNTNTIKKQFEISTKSKEEMHLINLNRQRSTSLVGDKPFNKVLHKDNSSENIQLSPQIQELMDKLNIDISHLNPILQNSTKMKLKRLNSLIIENNALESKESKMKVLLAGNFDDLPDLPIMLKVYDDKTRETKIKKISTASSYQTVVQNVHELINRDAILSVNLSDGVQTELSPVTLKSLFASFYKGESLYIFINAF